MSGLKFVWFAFRHHALPQRTKRGIIAISSGYKSLKFRTNYATVGSSGKNTNSNTKESTASTWKPLPNARKRYAVMICLEREKNKALIKVTSKVLQRALSKSKCSSLIAYSEKGENKVLTATNATEKDQSDVSPCGKMPENSNPTILEKDGVEAEIQDSPCKAGTPNAEKVMVKESTDVDNPANAEQNTRRKNGKSLTEYFITRILEKNRANAMIQGSAWRAMKPFSKKEIDKDLGESGKKLVTHFIARILEKNRANGSRQSKTMKPYSENEINMSVFKVDSPAKTGQNARGKSLTSYFRTRILQKNRLSVWSLEVYKAMEPHSGRETNKVMTKIDNPAKTEKDGHQMSGESLESANIFEGNIDAWQSKIRDVISSHLAKQINKVKTKIDNPAKTEKDGHQISEESLVSTTILEKNSFSESQGSECKTSTKPYSEEDIDKALINVHSPAKTERNVRRVSGESLPTYFSNKIKEKNRANAGSQGNMRAVYLNDHLVWALFGRPPKRSTGRTGGEILKAVCSSKEVEENDSHTCDKAKTLDKNTVNAGSQGNVRVLYLNDHLSGELFGTGPTAKKSTGRTDGETLKTVCPGKEVEENASHTCDKAKTLDKNPVNAGSLFNVGVIYLNEHLSRELFGTGPTAKKSTWRTDGETLKTVCPGKEVEENDSNTCDKAKTLDENPVNAGGQGSQGSECKVIEPYSEKVMIKALIEISKLTCSDQNVRHTHGESVIAYFDNKIIEQSLVKSGSQNGQFDAITQFQDKVRRYNTLTEVDNVAKADHNARHMPGENSPASFSKEIVEKNRAEISSQESECKAISSFQEKGNSKTLTETVNPDKAEKPALHTCGNPLAECTNNKNIPENHTNAGNQCSKFNANIPVKVIDEPLVEAGNTKQVENPAVHKSGETLDACVKDHTTSGSPMTECSSIMPSQEKVNRTGLIEIVIPAQIKQHALKTRAESLDAHFNIKVSAKDRANTRSHGSKCNTTTSHANKLMSNAFTEVISQTNSEEPAVRTNGESSDECFNTTESFGKDGVAAGSHASECNSITSQEKVNSKASIEDKIPAAEEQSSFNLTIETSVPQFNSKRFLKYPGGFDSKCSSFKTSLKKETNESLVKVVRPTVQPALRTITESSEDQLKIKDLANDHAKAESYTSKYNTTTPFLEKELSKALVVIISPNKMDKSALRKRAETLAACWNHFVNARSLDRKPYPFDPNQENEKGKALAKVESKKEAEEDMFGNGVDLSLLARLKLICKKYWYVFIPVHVVTSVGWLGGLYLVTKSGLDIPALLAHFHISEAYVARLQSSNMGYWALAYLLYHIVSPLRYAVTLGGTRYFIKYLTRKGISFKRVPTKKEILRWFRKIDRAANKKNNKDS